MHETANEIDSQPLFEAKFTLGNGYMGSRGILEECPPKAVPGTYFAGIFDHLAFPEAQIINAPNPFHLAVLLPQDEQLAIFKAQTESHERILDLQKGLLYRHSIFKSQNNTEFDYQSLRFVSMNDLHVAVMHSVISPLSQSCMLTIDTSIDLNVKNQGLRENIQTFSIDEQEQMGDVEFICIRSLDHQKKIAYAQKTVIHLQGKTQPFSSPFSTYCVNKEEFITITKYIVFLTSKDVIDPSFLKESALEKLSSIVDKGFIQLLEEHCQAFRRRWDLYDIKLIGDNEAQAALRFNIYHLLIAANENVKDTSIGAKTLSGEGYKGHVFWETELLLFPCYLFSEPSVARQLLEYRFHRLPAAKKMTESKGYKGVLFPWESADTGLNETPFWSQDFDGTIRPIKTGGNSLHINLAIFYAIDSYYNVTQDIDFMHQMGLSMIIEMARFWKKKVVHNRKKDLYKIKRIMGPDEFHEEVNNNAYTNMLVAWSLEKTSLLISDFLKNYPYQTREILKAHKFFTRELRKLKTIAEKMYIPTHNDILVQFDKYLKLKDVSPLTLDSNGLPMFPADVLVMDLFKTQYVKQADVILLILLLPNSFNREIAEKNFNFYDARTLHKSSWSPPIHSAVAAQLGLQDKAYHYLTISLNSDKKNLYGNTRDGVHTPAIGGSWIAIVYGLCGLRALEDRLVIMPNLPPTWSSISFKVLFRGIFIHIHIDQYAVSLHLQESANLGASIRVQVCGEIQELEAGSRCLLPLQACSIFDLG